MAISITDWARSTANHPSPRSCDRSVTLSVVDLPLDRLGRALGVLVRASALHGLAVPWPCIQLGSERDSAPRGLSGRGEEGSARTRAGHSYTIARPILQRCVGRRCILVGSRCSRVEASRSRPPHGGSFHRAHHRRVDRPRVRSGCILGPFGRSRLSRSRAGELPSVGRRMVCCPRRRRSDRGSKEPVLDSVRSTTDILGRIRATRPR